MALHDVDKNSADRGSPMPNTHDVQTSARMAHGTNSVNYVTDATPSVTGGNILSGNARLVSSGVTQCDASAGNDSTIVSDTFSIPHNLGYNPIVTAWLNNASVGFNLPLPIILSSTVGSTSGTLDGVAFLATNRWMTYGADEDNFYVIIYTVGSSMIATSYFVTYYLYQQVVN